MKYLKNINPFVPIKIDEVVEHSGRKISSKALINSENVEIRFFSVEEGESIDKEYYEMETIFFVINGSLKILYNKDEELVLNTGEMVALEGNIDYGIIAMTDTKMYNILVKK